MKTGMDNQLARCKVAEEEGWGIVLKHRTQKAIIQCTNQLIKSLPLVNNNAEKSGAWELAEVLNSKMEVLND